MRSALRRLDQIGYVSRGRSRHRPRDAARSYGGSYPLIQTGDVKHAVLYITSYRQTYSGAGLAQSKLWSPGTLCVTITGDIADTAILTFDACFPDSVIGFVPDENKADARFIKYSLDALLQKRCQSIPQGAAQKKLSQERLLSLQLPVPPVDVQRRVADVLAAYDKSIENNRYRIQLLEQSVRLLYKEWFIHLRFPGHEHVKVHNGVPGNWRRVALSDVIDINPAEKLERGKEAWYVPMTSLSEVRMTVDCSKLERREVHTSAKFRNGDVLLARISPCQENCRTAYVYFLENGEVASGSTEFMVLRGRKISQYFLYCLSRTQHFRAHAIKSLIGASGRQRVQASCFDDLFIGLPPAPLQEQFDELVADSFRQIRLLEHQNGMLRKARDQLLPRLISGAISQRVSD